MERFCQEYLTDLNGTAAYIRAGGSPRSAYQLAHTLLRDERIAARIGELMQERERATRVKSYRILEEIAAVALSSLDHFTIDDRGFVALTPDAPSGAMGAVARIRRKARVLETTTRVNGVETSTSALVEYDTEIALVDKNPQLTNAMKHLGLLVDRHEVTGKDGGPIAVDVVELRERIAQRLARSVETT